MKYAIIYTKDKGNTRELADTVREALPEKDLIYFGEPDDKALEADLIHIGFWTNQGICDDRAKDFIKKIHGKEVFFFGSAGFGEDNYYREIIKRTSDLLSKDNTVTGSFMCQGRMMKEVRARYEKMAENPELKEKAEMLIKNFDVALSHPDSKDKERLGKTVEALYF